VLINPGWVPNPNYLKPNPQYAGFPGQRPYDPVEGWYDDRPSCRDCEWPAAARQAGPLPRRLALAFSRDPSCLADQWVLAPCPGRGRPLCRWASGRSSFWYCSRKCAGRLYARRWRARQRKAAEGRPPPVVRCAVCGRDFNPPRKDARTCSPACRQKAYRRRKGVTDQA
jgi:hypothetical protein